MKRLLAIGVIDSWEGTWHFPQGNEGAVIAAPIGKGEEVRLEVELTEEPSVLVIPLSAEPVHLQTENWVRYRVVKDASRAIERLATSVEMILHVSRREARGLSHTQRGSGQ